MGDMADDWEDRAFHGRGADQGDFDRGDSSYVYLDVKEIRRVTEKAMLLAFDVEQDDGSCILEEEWFPRSQIEGRGEDYEAGDKDLEIGITDWIAEKKGLQLE